MATIYFANTCEYVLKSCLTCFLQQINAQNLNQINVTKFVTLGENQGFHEAMIVHRLQKVRGLPKVDFEN